MKEKLATPEYQVNLTKSEIEQILLDAHDHLGAALVHWTNSVSYNVPNIWLRRRIWLLKNLIAKLEPLLDQNNEETRNPNPDRRDQPE
jgi:hypothetical protein